MIGQGVRNAAVWMGAAVLALLAHAALAWVIEARSAAAFPPLALMQAQIIDLAPVMEFAEAEAKVEAPPAMAEPVKEPEAKAPEPEQASSPAPEPEKQAEAEPEPPVTEPEPTVAEAPPSPIPPVRTVEPQKQPEPPRRPRKPVKAPKKIVAQETRKPVTVTQRASQIGAPPVMSAQRARAATAPKVDPSRWHGSVRSAVARQAKRVRGKKGTVTVSFVVNGSGAIVSARVARSSGDGALDQAAVNAVRAARAPVPPKGVEGSSHNFSVPLTFR